jgi:DUF1365 family protein
VTARYRTTVQHVRRSPFKHAFSYGSSWWLVDLDDLPRLPRWLASFESRDHVGDPVLTLRENLDRLLASRGIRADRIWMMSSARSLGHVFNPMSVFWCLSDGTVVATVVEVHNTYGGRHAYVLEPDVDGRAETAKELYVSPFHEVQGQYALRLPFPGAEVSVDVTYTRPDGLPFVATVRGTRCEGSLLSQAVRSLCSTRLVALRIRVQGIRLYLRGLPVVPRTRIKEQIS